MYYIFGYIYDKKNIWYIYAYINVLLNIETSDCCGCALSIGCAFKWKDEFMAIICKRFIFSSGVYDLFQVFFFSAAFYIKLYTYMYVCVCLFLFLHMRQLFQFFSYFSCVIVVRNVARFLRWHNCALDCDNFTFIYFFYFLETFFFLNFLFTYFTLL